MGYSESVAKMDEYRSGKISALIGEKRVKWFTELWSTVSQMLDTVESSAENKAIISKYATSPTSEKVPDHIHLDYVCGLRREIRKQYVSEDAGIYTDVTPYRHGIMSTHGARLFDSLMAQVYDKNSGGKSQ